MAKAVMSRHYSDDGIRAAVLTVMERGEAPQTTGGE